MEKVTKKKRNVRKAMYPHVPSIHIEEISKQKQLFLHLHCQILKKKIQSMVIKYYLTDVKNTILDRNSMIYCSRKTGQIVFNWKNTCN